MPAGTLDWSCTATADHAVDCVFAPATFLASRRTDRYPDMPIFTAGPDATAAQLVESLAVMCRILVDVVAGADPEVPAVLFGGREPITGPPADFLPRGALELILHGHDVCAGLGVAYEPDSELCRRLRDHTAGLGVLAARVRRRAGAHRRPVGRPARRLRPRSLLTLQKGVRWRGPGQPVRTVAEPLLVRRLIVRWLAESIGTSTVSLPLDVRTSTR